MQSLTDAQALLLAAQYVVEPDLTKLQVLASKRPSILTPTLLYRLLITYLPTESSIESSLAYFLQNLESGFNDISDLDTPEDKFSEDITVGNAEEKLKDLRLEQVPSSYSDNEVDLLTVFLVEWTHRIEAVNGISSSTINLVDAFASGHSSLLNWRDTYLLPLYRLQNEFYPEKADSLDLQEIESVRGLQGVNTLLQFAEHEGKNAEIKRDLDQVVTPWVSGSSKAKRRRITVAQPDSDEDLLTQTSWRDVNQWILLNSRENYELSGKAILAWDGPLTSDDSGDNMSNQDDNLLLAYAQTGFAVAYATTEREGLEIQLRKEILRRVAMMAQLMPPETDVSLPTISDVPSLARASKADLLENAFLRPGNPLTTPSTDAVEFLHGVLATQQLLHALKLSPSTITIAATSLFDSEEKQKQELRTILNQIPRLTKSNTDWANARKQLLWLHSWQETPQDVADSGKRVAYLSRISSDYLETEILDAMLAVGEYVSIIPLYLESPRAPLTLDVVKDRVVGAIYNAYDNASNGNRTRGGMKKASDILKAFQPYFRDDRIFSYIEHLVKATHSLSFYQLTLQHGVPFQPVNIRVHRDPLSLIGKVLEQNPKAYTKLDDLLEIGRHLVLADLPTPLTPDTSPEERASVERRVFDAEHRITFEAFNSALEDHDFDTAYSYITTRLSTTPSQSQTSPFTDDTSWRAAYAAGKYRPISAPASLHDRIASLSKRMDLLSLALVLEPTPEHLPEILGTWRRCEEEMDSLKSQALEEERAFEAKGDTTVPGGFGPDDRDLDAAETRRMMERRALGGSAGPSYEEDAPVGLFDVARGAANAFRRSAFPLRGGPQGIKVHQSQSRTSQDSGRGSTDLDRPGSAEGEHRVRKRDMISSAVTGGLVSGMSWVLGAQPAAQREQE